MESRCSGGVILSVYHDIPPPYLEESRAACVIIWCTFYFIFRITLHSYIYLRVASVHIVLHFACWLTFTFYQEPSALTNVILVNFKEQKKLGLAQCTLTQ